MSELIIHVENVHKSFLIAPCGSGETTMLDDEKPALRQVQRVRALLEQGYDVELS